MKTFNHTVALRMEAGGLDPQNTEDGADLRPNGGRKLSSVVQVSRAGTPNRETQVEIKTLAQVSAVMEDGGMASGHLEVLSIIVSRELYPWLAGSGPKRSRCT